MAKKKLKIKSKLVKAGNGLITDPRIDSYYTPSSSDARKDYKLNSESKGSKSNPIIKPEVEIVSKRTNPLGWTGQVSNSENTNPYLQVGSAKLASDLFVTPITESLHIPSRLLNQGIGLYKGNYPNYDSEIHQTLGLKDNDPTDLWQGARNFAIDNVADVALPMAPEAGIKFAKNRALNIIGQHPGHARSFGDILEGTFLNNKREYFGNWGVPERDVYGYGKRDLPKLLIHGDENGFKPINYSDPGMNPNYKTYQMNSAIKHGQPLKWQELANEIKGSNPEFEFHQDFTKDPERFKEMMKELAESKGDKGVLKFDIRPNADYKGLRLSNNPIYPEDDVAGHMGFFDTNTMQWNSRDQWGFTPAYDVRYKSTPFQKLQRQAVEKIGKPFNLAQENPIDFSPISKDYQPRVVHNLNVEGEDFWNNLDKWKQKDYTELLKKDYVKSPKFKELYKKDKREFGGQIELEKVNELDMAKNVKKIKMKNGGKNDLVYNPTGSPFDTYRVNLDSLYLNKYPYLRDNGTKGVLTEQEVDDLIVNHLGEDKLYFDNNSDNFPVKKGTYIESPEFKSGGSIKINPKNKGKFNATKKATGKTTEELTHSKNPVTKKRAIFAQNAAKWNKKEEGGELYDIKAPYVYSYSHGGYVPLAQTGWTGWTNEDPAFGIGDQGYNEQLMQQGKQLGEVAGVEPSEFNPALTYSLEQYNTSKGISSNPYLNSKEQKEYAQYKDKQNQPSNGLNIATQAVGYVNKGIKDVKKWANNAGSTIQNNAVAGIESEQRRANLMGQYQNTLPQFSNNWHGRNSLEGVYTQVKYGGMMQNGGSMEQQSNGIPSKFTKGKRHYEGGTKVNMNLPYSNANDLVDNKNPTLEVEPGEYIVPGMQNGGQAQNDVILSDRKNVGIGGMSPSEILEEESKKIKINGDTAELGISSNKFNKGITKGEDFRADNVKFLSPTLAEQTASTVKLLAAPITKNIQELAQNTYVQQELTKQSKGMDNDLDSIMQSNQQPMAKYGAQIPDDMNYYDTGKMFMANGGSLPMAQNGSKSEGLDFFSGDQKSVYNYAKSKGYKGKNDIGKLQKWAVGYDPRGVADYTLMVEPSNKALEAYNARVNEVNKTGANLPLAKTTKEVDMSIFSPKERLDIFQDDLWRFRYPKVKGQNKPVDITSPVKEEKPSDVVDPIKGDFSSIKSRNTLQQMPSFNMYIPNEYAAKPITSYDVNPYFQQPHTISPYINDIQRLQYAANANLGTSGAELATRANLFGQGLQEYGKRYYDASVYNAGAKTQADAQNAQAAYQAAIGNRGNQWQTESAQNQRDAAMQGQLELDKNPYLKMMADKDYEQRMGMAAKNIYNQDYIDPWKYAEVNPNDSESVKKAKEDLLKAKYFQDKKKYEPGLGKFGGKVNKLNTKKFKSKK